MLTGVSQVTADGPMIGIEDVAVALRPMNEITEWVAWYLRPFWPCPAAARAEWVVEALAAEPGWLASRAPQRIERVVGYYGHVGWRHPDGSVDLPSMRVTVQRTEDGCRVIGEEDRWTQFIASVATRQIIRAHLESAGWVMCHAGAVVVGGRATLIVGDSGSGKTSLALNTALELGVDLLANDRCLIRSTASGTEALAWAMPISIGLGLLESLGWMSRVRDSVRSGDLQHHFQPQEITHALRSGDTNPIYRNDGRELKYELYPANLVDWFGVELVTSAPIAAVVHPRYGTGDAPRLEPLTDPLPALAIQDSQIYPDLLGVGTEEPGVRERSLQAVLAGLRLLPHAVARWGTNESLVRLVLPEFVANTTHRVM